MNSNANNERLYLIWKNPVIGYTFVVGALTQDNGYVFKYGYEYKRAKREGFKPLIAFADTDKAYHSAKLFFAFSSRLPDRKRPDIDNILSRNGLEEYDEFQLLKATGGRLPIDNIYFISTHGMAE